MAKNKFDFLDSYIELMKLERKHSKNWKKTPPNIQEEMIRLCLENEGFHALANKNYLDYIIDIKVAFADSFADFKDGDPTLREKLQWFAERLNDFYTRERRKDWVIKRKLANMYLKVENHRKKNKKLSIKKATDIVAKEIGEAEKYVHTRYYEFRYKHKSLSIDDIKKLYYL